MTHFGYSLLGPVPAGALAYQIKGSNVNPVGCFNLAGFPDRAEPFTAKKDIKASTRILGGAECLRQMATLEQDVRDDWTAAIVRAYSFARDGNLTELKPHMDAMQAAATEWNIPYSVEGARHLTELAKINLVAQADKRFLNFWGNLFPQAATATQVGKNLIRDIFAGVDRVYDHGYLEDLQGFLMFHCTDVDGTEIFEIEMRVPDLGEGTRDAICITIEVPQDKTQRGKLSIRSHSRGVVHRLSENGRSIQSSSSVVGLESYGERSTTMDFKPWMKFLRPERLTPLQSSNLREVTDGSVDKPTLVRALSETGSPINDELAFVLRSLIIDVYKDTQRAKAERAAPKSPRVSGVSKDLLLGDLGK